MALKSHTRPWTVPEPARKAHKKTAPLDSDSEAMNDLATLATTREQSFALYYLASKNAAHSAGKAGYHGDLKKRSRGLLAHPELQAFLEKYQADIPETQRVDVTKKAVLEKLADIASANLEKVTTSHIIDALKLLGDHLGLFQLDMAAGKDRLNELIACFEKGPIKTEAAKDESGNSGKAESGSSEK
jgi:hypothetical protein